MTGKIAGMDFGLKTFLTLDNGEKESSPLFFKQGSKRIAKANQSVSRKQRGSKNRRKARKSLAREHWKISCRREDFQWKLALSLVRSYDILCVEDLNIKAMQRLWGRKISDLGFSDFLKKLEYLCAREGKALVRIDRWYPSSKTCSSCGSVLETLSLSERKWTCPECHTHHDRDINAAVNIRNEGLRMLSMNSVGASTDMPEAVRPETSGVLQRAWNPTTLVVGVCQFTIYTFVGHLVLVASAVYI
jgi:putative transposase